VRCSFRFLVLGLLAAPLMAGCGDESVANAAWSAMCAAYCEQGVECFPDASASECRSLCLDEVKDIPCEADPVLLDECVAGMDNLSCDEIQAGELPRVCNRMCTGGLCEGVDCDDGKECTDDICNSVDGTCDNEPLPDGTPCSEGGCEDLVCTSVFSCTEDGILTAIATGGGPYTFACDGPTTIETSERIVIDNDVILDGEGNLRLDGRGLHTVLSVFGAPTAIAVELRGFELTGSANNGAGISSNQASLTVSDCMVLGNAGGGIHARGTLTVNNSMVSENGGAGIGSDGTLTVNNGVVADNDGGGVFGTGTSEVNDSTVSGNSSHEGGGVSCLEGEMTLNNVAIIGNTAPWAGGIHVGRDCTLTLTDSTVSENTANESQSGGGIFSDGALFVNDSIVSNNTAGGGGGVHCSGGSSLSMDNSTVSGNNATNENGGGISVDGLATVTNSTISENAADNGGGIARGNGELTLNDSAVWRNTARQNGGGIYGYHGTLTATNVRGSENTAAEAGGGVRTSGDSIFVSSTISSNVASSASAVFLDGGARFLNSVLEGDCFVDDWAVVVSSGGNIESPGDTCALDGSIDRVNVTSIDLSLGPLKDNGGPTLTQAPEPPSAAIDTVENCVNAESQPLTADQRGVTRPQGPQCDVGAVEVAREP